MFALYSTVCFARAFTRAGISAGHFPPCFPLEDIFRTRAKARLMARPRPHSPTAVTAL